MAISLLAKKLQLKPGMRMLVLEDPEDYLAQLEPLPDGASIATAPEDDLSDAVHLFVTSSADLARSTPTVLAALRPGGLLWIAYPKKFSGIETDLTRDVGWQAISDAGWRPIRQISVDSTWSALRFRPVEHERDVDAIDAQYARSKAHLRPILDKIVAAADSLGLDVQQKVRKSYVALARGKQFANIVPSTRSRVDLAIRLPGIESHGRLQPAGNIGSGSMTHRIALTSADEVDDQVLKWLRQAYEGVA